MNVFENILKFIILNILINKLNYDKQTANKISNLILQKIYYKNEPETLSSNFNFDRINLVFKEVFPNIEIMTGLTESIIDALFGFLGGNPIKTLFSLWI